MEPNLQLQIAKLFEQKQTERLIETLNASPHLIFEIFEVFPEVLLSSNNQNIENTFDVLEALIQTFGMAFVLQLNTDEIVTILQSLAEGRWERRVNKLLELCLVAFSFDKERTNIESLANLWIAHNIGAGSYPTKKVSLTPFITFFCNLQKTLALCQDVPNLTPQEKQKCATHIKQVLKHENFENKDFNPLEKDLAIYYQNELISTLATIQPKSSVQNLKEIENDVQEVIKKSQETPGKDVAPATSPLGKNSVLLQNRTSFVLGERITEDESIRTEFKEYSAPFGDIVEKTLKKTIGAFLNRRGGRIYIGISDSKIVKGILLKFKERDTLRLQIQNMLKVFEPPLINLERVDIVEIPVRNRKDNEIIPGCFVLKIIIKQGDPSKLYSVNNLSYESYIRNQGQNTLLTAREISGFILQRATNPDQKVPDQEFDDPKPDEIEDIFEKKEGEDLSTSKILYDLAAKRKKQENYQNSMNAPVIKNNFQDKPKQNFQAHMNNQQNPPVGLNKNNNPPNMPNNQAGPYKPKAHVVFVQGLPPFKQQQFNELLGKMGFKTLFYHRMFMFKDGNCNGKAFLNFRDPQEAKQIINAWNGKKIENSIVRAELKNE